MKPLDYFVLAMALLGVPVFGAIVGFFFYWVAEGIQRVFRGTRKAYRGSPPKGERPMAVIELTGFTAQAEILGSSRQVHYEDGVLEVRGVSLGEARTAIERLATGTLQAVNIEGSVGKVLDAVAQPPAETAAAPAPKGKPGKARPSEVLAGIQSGAVPPEAKPNGETKAHPAETKPAGDETKPPKAETKAPTAETTPPPKGEPAPPSGYSFDEACKVAKDWTAIPQPLNYLIAHGVKDPPAIEAEVLKMAEKGVLSFFANIEPDAQRSRVKRAIGKMEIGA